MNPDENQPQSEQPNVNPAPAPESNDTAPASNEFSAAPAAPATEPAPQPAPTFAQPVAVQPQANTSKGLAIASLVLGILGFLTAFLGIGILLGLVAVVLGIISLVKHHGGKGMAIAGLIVGALTFMFGGILLLMALSSYSGVQNHAKTNLNQTNAAAVIKSAEAYNAATATGLDDNYPTYDQLVSDTKDTMLDETAKADLHEGTLDSVSAQKPLAYHGCKAGAAVYYWDAISSAVKTDPYTAGDPSKC